MKLEILLLCLTGNLAVLSASGADKLTGTVIGSQYSVDYATGNSSTTVNTKAMVFDGNPNTFFASYDRSNTWVGLDLGKEFVISRIGYMPRNAADCEKRVKLAVLEGSNRPDFLDAIPFYIIPESGTIGTMTYADISCSRGFRYVRYVGPNDSRCNLAELEFYGTEGVGDDTKLYQLTNLPVLSIHCVNEVDIDQKETDIPSWVAIVSENGTKLISDTTGVRGRGNSSWKLFEKKPYRIKFGSKQLVPGATTKSKKWTLLSNHDDKTLMRNMLAFEISRRMGFKFTSIATPVDVILNGEYKGTYTLCDQIEVAKGRVDVEEMEVTDVALPNLSGGYLLEIDGFANEETSWFTSKNYQVPVTIKYPKDDEIVPAQSNYIANFFASMEAKVKASNFEDATSGYRSLLDIETFRNYLLLSELTGNPDAWWSVYMYKFRNEDKLYTGPAWDFDIAFDNDSRVHSYIANPYTFLYLNGGFYPNSGYLKTLCQRVFQSDKNASAEILEAWKKMRTTDNISYEQLCDYIDRAANDLDESQKLNFKRWDILNTKIYNNFQALGSFSAEVDYVKSYLKKRFDFLDKLIGFDPTSGIETADASASGRIYSDGAELIVSGFDGTVKFEVFNISGAKVAQGECDRNGSCPIAAPGVYIVKAKDAAGKVTNKKLIIP